MKTKLKLQDAERLGVSILATLNTLNMITAGLLAGSVRREVQEVGDIELLVFAKYGKATDALRQMTLFQPPPEFIQIDLMNTYTPLLFEKITHLIPGLKNGQKYKQWIYDDDTTRVNIDCFICHDRDQWGLLLALRTGSAGFMKVLATHIKYNLPGVTWQAARLWEHEDLQGRALQPGDKANRIATPTETDFFNAIGLATIPPNQRNEAAARRLVAAWTAHND
ncbi:MAG: hypothetical protein KAJ07_04665 [Planctomycetes bacterium]|nr:hypothetical protein [Planctomycetota bacterium]